MVEASRHADALDQDELQRGNGGGEIRVPRPALRRSVSNRRRRNSTASSTLLTFNGNCTRAMHTLNIDVCRIDFCIDHCQYSAMKQSVATPSICCAPVLQRRLSQGAAEQIAGAFKALADPARLRLLSFIAAQPSGEACVCHLMKPLDISQPTVSHHLKVLFDAGLLARERRGTWVYYRIVPERLAALRDALALPNRRPQEKFAAGKR
jgi:ArsR family transcriptional regulator